MENSTSDSTVNNESWPLHPRSEGIAFCIGYLIESINIIVGNIITICVFTRNRKLRKRKYYLLISLAVADFLVGAVVVPWWVYDLALYFDLWVWKGNQFNSAVAAEALDLFTKYASLITLMTVSLERMYATLWPLKHRVIEARTYYMLIAFSWTLSILMPSVRVADIYELMSENTFLYILLSFTCLILLIIFASYISIWIKIKYGRHPRHHVTTAKNVKLTASLFLVTMISLVTWLPAPVVYSAFRFTLMSGSTSWSYSSYDRVYYSVMMLVFANSLVNPIIYSFRLPHFRDTAVRLVCRYSPETREERMRSFTGTSSLKLRSRNLTGHFV